MIKWILNGIGVCCAGCSVIRDVDGDGWELDYD